MQTKVLTLITWRQMEERCLVEKSVLINHCHHKEVKKISMLVCVLFFGG